MLSFSQPLGNKGLISTQLNEGPVQNGKFETSPE